MYWLLQSSSSWRASILPVTEVPTVLPEVVMAPSSAEVLQLPMGISSNSMVCFTSAAAALPQVMAMASASAREWVDFMPVFVYGARRACLLFVSGGGGDAGRSNRGGADKKTCVHARAGAAKHCRGRIVPDPVSVCRTRRDWQVARAWRMLQLICCLIFTRNLPCAAWSSKTKPKLPAIFVPACARLATTSLPATMASTA